MSDIFKDLADTFEQIKNQKVEPCKHVVSPAEFKRGGWARCANCYKPINLGPGSGA